MNQLDEILSHKRQEVAQKLKIRSLASVRQEAESLPLSPVFLQALKDGIQNKGLAVIAEIKKASPSKGVIREQMNPVAIAKSYQAGGATALSVLTDSAFFQGQDVFLAQAGAATGLPCLRKDFMLDVYQIFESKVLAAHCVLLIVAALDDARLRELYQTARAIGLDVLMEVHSEAELQRALALKPDFVGINNRNLRSFETRLTVSEALSAQIPAACLAISESGIATRDDVNRIRAAGLHGFLVGESLMRHSDPGRALADLFPELSG